MEPAGRREASSHWRNPGINIRGWPRIALRSIRATFAAAAAAHGWNQQNALAEAQKPR